MRHCQLILLCLAACLLALTQSSSDQQHPSSEDRVYKHDLSDWDHDEDEDEDDYKYDHDAFLGKEDSEKFDKMSPEESKENLGLLVDKIDTDKDGYVTERELIEWIDKVSKRYINEESKKQFADLTASPTLSWEEYRAKNKDDDDDDDDAEDEEAKSAAAKTLARDMRRWKAADVDGDGRLNLQEFTEFTHPEESPKLRHLVGIETMEDMDKNGDGSVDVEEYISDLWKPSQAEPAEPDWLTAERTTFSNERDTNKDGRLDLSEVTNWIVPANFNHAASEARHLIQHADADKDGRLSKAEILDKHDLFAGSQVTDFGEALGDHDEL